MSYDVTQFFGAKRSAPQGHLEEALAKFASTKSAISGNALLKLAKATGLWVYGQGNTKVEDADRFVVDPSSFATGYIAWYLGKIEKEVMQPLTDGPVDPNSLDRDILSGTVPPGKREKSGRGWENQVQFELVLRDKVPVKLIYKASSRGGIEGVLDLASEIAFGLYEGQGVRAYPAIRLARSSYEHDEYGTVYTPKFVVEAWLDASGNAIEEKKSLL